jgi:hypothetical protein
VIDRIRREPAVVIGILFAAILAAVQSLAGNGVVEPDIVATVQRALDPSSGWALPIVAGVVTRFFVSPAK